jgi:hypothetical protein
MLVVAQRKSRLNGDAGFWPMDVGRSEAKIPFQRGCMIQIRERHRVERSFVLHSLHERAKLDENSPVDFLIKSGNLVKLPIMQIIAWPHKFYRF